MEQGLSGRQPVAAPTGVSRPRMEWMDTLRGTAIALMLLWHATAVPPLYGIEVPAVVTAVNDALLPFRMPTLMFLSGLLLPRAVRKPLWQYYRGKIAHVAWPYVLWVVVLAILMGQAALLWHPRLYLAKGYLWYLFFLGTYYLVAPLVRRWLAGPWLVLALWVASFLVTPSLPHRMLYFAVFFFLGAAVASHGTDLVAWLERRRVLVLGLAGVALALAVASALVDLTYVSALAPASACGVLAAVVVARRVPRGRAPRVRFVGRNSIVFYVVHFPVMMLVCEAGAALGAPWWLVLPVCLVAGGGAGWALALVRDRPAVRWLFDMPVLARPVGTRSPDRPSTASVTTLA